MCGGGLCLEGGGLSGSVSVGGVFVWGGALWQRPPPLPCIYKGLPTPSESECESKNFLWCLNFFLMISSNWSLIFFAFAFGRCEQALKPSSNNLQSNLLCKGQFTPDESERKIFLCWLPFSLWSFSLVLWSFSLLLGVDTPYGHDFFWCLDLFSRNVF